MAHVSDTRRAIEAVWRIESARLIGGLVRVFRDLDLAEDLAQEALLLALERWEESGIPASPGAWLMTTAKNRGLDRLRRARMMERKHQELGHELEHQGAPSSAITAAQLDAALDREVADDVLRLMLVACHPILSADARVALTLRLLGGLTTEEIARAFLVPTSTMAQRIVRAKRTLSKARVPFEVPRGDDLQDRLGSVLESIYLIFNEGYSATSGDEMIRRSLGEEALRLGRILAGHVPEEAEVHGLLALMELHWSRTRARTDPSGRPILLADQDRSRWDRLLVTRGLESLARAESMPGPSGPYTLQAGIAACHARARTVEETDWETIVALYDGLVELTHSPVVELNRAVAVSMAYGPAAGLELVAPLLSEPALASYHLLPCVRADFLARLGRMDEARREFKRAALMTDNARERALLLERARECE